MRSLHFGRNDRHNNFTWIGLATSKALCINKGVVKKMNTNRSFFNIACRVAAFSFLMAGTVSLLQAQQSQPAGSTFKAPLLLASESAPANSAASSFSIFSSSSSSSLDSASASDSDARPTLDSAALDTSQPPPRRRYGRPNYSSGNTNPDGSSKYTFIVGVGPALPVGNSHKYETLSYDFQVGGGRNFNKTVGVLLQFDYDHFGLQGATLANQTYVYNYYCTPAFQASGACTLVTGLDGNNHVWSFTLNPTFTLPTEGSLGAYAVVGGGYYHKVTNFTLPTTGYYYDPYYGPIAYSANQTVDHYTSNAAGINAGLGLTYKFSKFSNQRFYVEGRYVVVFNQHYAGVTAANVATFGATYNGYNDYPANSNRTTYIPIKIGIRF
jgi:hypothetical protein